MAERFYFKDSGSIELPIDGTFLTGEYPIEYESGYIVIALYDSNGDIVTPSAGTCTVEASPIDGQWHNGVTAGDAVIDLTLAGASATYTIPLFKGPHKQARITLASVAGANSAKAYIWRA